MGEGSCSFRLGWRRRFHEEKDIDSINDHNEHFSKKIERAFGKYTLEIKNNLERRTALPD
ncbi:hypothetical protein TanjilG_01805 [Lupinus angustifolius]|nr:hypothetical protein TanjilG_01805 [Lupinus angustifolius]